MTLHIEYWDIALDLFNWTIVGIMFSFAFAFLVNFIMGK